MGFSGEVPDTGSARSIAHAGFSAVVEARAKPMIDALSGSSSVLLLTGEPGVGKSYMAEYVGRALESEEPGTVRAFVLPRPPETSEGQHWLFGAVAPAPVSVPGTGTDTWFSDTFRAARLAELILESAQEAAGDAQPLLVLPGVDCYSASAAAVLEHLVRLEGVRIIATAHHLRGGAAQMVRDPRTARITVAPLDLSEADELLSSLLGSARVDPATLRRWHAATGGNSQALSLMLVANERSGVIRRGQGIVWVPPAREQIPDEFVRYLDRSCTQAQRETLDLLALADPMCETPLLRLLDPAATNALLDQGLITAQPTADGRPALRIRRSILAVAIRSRMSPPQRILLAEELFRALTEGEALADFAHTSPHLLAAVDFGLQSGRTLPHDWLATAMSRLPADTDPRLTLRISLALANGYTTADAGAAALRALSCAVQLGDNAATSTARLRIDELIADQRALSSFPSVLRTRLRMAQIDRSFVLGVSMSEVLEALDELEATLNPHDEVSREAVRGLRFRLLLRDADFVAAAEVMPDEGTVSEDLIIEWVRVPARSASATLLQQQGRLDEAIRVSSRARSIAMVGRRPLNDTVELDGLHWFLGYWASGSAGGARGLLEEVEADANVGRNAGGWVSELVDMAWALLALQEARWRDAADLVGLILESGPPDDPYGAAPLLQAVLALSLAALGEHEGAMAALERARTDQRGVSQALAGFRRRLNIQVLQWLHCGDPGAEALELAAWAREQRLPLIELEALHIAAVESRKLARAVRPRARELAESIDPIVSEVIVAHIEKVAAGGSPTDVSEPEVRLLSELGLWTPLPESTALSAREREVALLAALGYSSRLIAERFHLSTRTVETHLAHVYAKLGIADREELRQWFSVDRSAA